jgi:hypothetical protein
VWRVISWSHLLFWFWQGGLEIWMLRNICPPRKTVLIPIRNVFTLEKIFRLKILASKGFADGSGVRHVP